MKGKIIDMGFLNRESWREKKESAVYLKDARDITSHKDVVTKLTHSYMIYGIEFLRRASILAVEDCDGKQFIVKLRPGYNSEINNAFMPVSSKAFEGHWTALERLEVLESLDIAGMNVLYRLDSDVRIEEDEGGFTVKKIIVSEESSSRFEEALNKLSVNIK